MKTLISLTKPLLEFPLPAGGTGEVYACAEGSYDAPRQLLFVQLDAGLRASGAPFEPELPAWLPRPQLLREHVSAEEATTLARDIFRHWVEKVRRSIPTDLRPAHVLSTQDSAKELRST